MPQPTEAPSAGRDDLTRKPSRLSLRANIAANATGQAWRAVMSFAFVPIYIKYLGVESYGMIGLFAVLQSWLGLLDLGMRPMLSREMARYTGGAVGPQTLWDLLRSVEIVSFALAFLMALGVWCVSGWLAVHWVRPEKLPTLTIAHALTIMGAVVALQFVESLYGSSIAGLQRQVLHNGITSVVATLRGLGSVAVLLWIAPTLTAYLIWQGIVSLVSVGLFAAATYLIMPALPKAARFSRPAIAQVWRFSAGMFGIAILGLLLTQMDKLLLSRQLPLESFAHYTLAAMAAGALSTIVAPLGAAYYPRISELVARGNQEALRSKYHEQAQLVAIFVGSAAMMLTIFGDRLLLIWTQDESLTHAASPILSVLAVGTLLNALMGPPYLLQLAHGWTSLTIKVNCAAVFVLVPALLCITPLYGATGAAWVWVVLNVFYAITIIYFLHKRLLKSDKYRWYLEDTLAPLLAAAGVAGLARWLMPQDLSRLAECALLVVCGGGALAAAGLAAPVCYRLAKVRLTVNGRWTTAKHEEGKGQLI